MPGSAAAEHGQDFGFQVLHYQRRRERKPIGHRTGGNAGLVEEAGFFENAPYVICRLAGSKQLFRPRFDQLVDLVVLRSDFFMIDVLAISARQLVGGEDIGEKAPDVSEALLLMFREGRSERLYR
ncbi:MAG: hypothetical protein CVV08_10430 [Gammaproteobacteria bacterium HGW-Gammaproteobacteria-12]|nr:MAG: hypothetical protein CVV08_10430 [Gammaproteobacteria bacterium HGW-Gammaproteobacteria-12]